MNDKRMLSIVAIVVAASFWGVIGVFSRELRDRGLDAIQVTEVRCIVTAVALFMILLIYDRRLLKIDPKDIWMFIGSGVIGIVSFNVLYFEAAEIVSLSMTAVLLYTAPFFVVILSAFLFKEALTKQKGLSLVLAFTGCLLISGIIGSSDGFNVKGFLLGLGSGIGYALYTIFGKIALKKYHPFTLTFYTFAVAGICLIPFSDIAHMADVAVNVSDAWIWMLALGILITTLPYFLYNFGLNGLDAGIASVMAFIEPMVATIAGFVIYNEAPTVFNFMGIMLILTAVILLNIQFGGKAEEPSTE
ncbi:MAG: EamA family transporter [Candidatus Methanomethylophilaceae archaeon]|nr:EamA family transporter [Candidatus Methanomethylophilaceae archaeon]MBQ6548099.1 EamA family transporter [Candidatus Methanomethylophilaceae archaeon]